MKGGLLDRISPQFWSILILEGVFILFTQQNNELLSAFNLVSAFMGKQMIMGMISKHSISAFHLVCVF